MFALGTIDYLNTQPIERGAAERLPGVEVVRGVPTAINRALKLAGITQSTPNAAGGTIDRDPAGRPTGVLKEGAQDSVHHVIPATTVAEELNGILASLDEMHREGMTGVKDPAISPTQWEA